MNNFNPYVRFAIARSKRFMRGLLQAIDHRIFYCHNGNGLLEVDGRLYPFMAGTLLYIPAGTPYRFQCDQDTPFFWSCNFDFYQEHSHLRTPIPPIQCEEFNEEDILEKQVVVGGELFSQCIYLENAFSFEDKCVELAEEFINHNLYYDVRCSTLLKDILIQIARIMAGRTQSINHKKADEILQYIHSQYHLPLTNKEVAEKFNYHENYLSAMMQKYTGLTLHQYVLHYKMHMAVIYLQSSDMSVSEVAEKVGMPDIKHFSKCFKRVIGHAPSKFKIK